MSAKWKVTVFGGIVAAISLILLAPVAQAGTFTTGTFTGDSDSPVGANGIYTSYTHAIDIYGANATTLVNGIKFTSSGQTTLPPSGTNYSTTGFSIGFPNNTNTGGITTGGLYNVLSDFAYGAGDLTYGDTTIGKSTLTLTGLSANKTYLTNVYVAGWGGPLIDVRTSNGDSRIGWNRGTDSGGAYLQYKFTTAADQDSLTFSFTPQSAGNTLHFYGFSNELLNYSPLPGLFSTGVDDMGKPLANGAAETHWTLTSVPDGAGTTPKVVKEGTAPIGPWAATTAQSAWISPSSTASDINGNYTYQTTFNLTGTDFSGLSLKGRLQTDDSMINMYLNDTLILSGGGGFGDWTSFDITSGFKTGTNTLSITLVNGGTAANPTGLRVEFIPEPGTLSLMVTGLFGLICYAWRKRKA